MRIMQNHPIYKTTPEQGWAQMVPVLDKAMPVARRSRRILAYWWTAAAVILAVVITRMSTPDVMSIQKDQDVSRNTEVSKPAITETTTQQSDIAKSAETTAPDNTTTSTQALVQNENASKVQSNIGETKENLAGSPSAQL